MTTTYTPRVYVGTYSKYNSGSIAGKWLDLEDYSDKGEFLEACAELHSDESGPELMFQDWESIPEGMISESSIDEELWAWIDLDDDDKELLSVAKENISSDITIDQARDSFSGKYDSPEDWAEQFIDDCGMLDGMADNLKQYFDYKAYARDCELGGDITFVRHDGETWAFNNSY